MLSDLTNALNLKTKFKHSNLIFPVRRWIIVAFFVGSANDVMMRRCQQKRQNRMTDDVIDSETVTRSSCLVVNVKQGCEFGLVGKSDAPEVQRAVGVLRNHLDDRRRLVLVNDAGSFCLLLLIVIRLQNHEKVIEAFLVNYSMKNSIAEQTTVTLKAFIISDLSDTF